MLRDVVEAALQVPVESVFPATATSGFTYRLLHQGPVNVLRLTPTHNSACALLAPLTRAMDALLGETTAWAWAGEDWPVAVQPLPAFCPARGASEVVPLWEATEAELAEKGNDRRSVFEGQLLQVEILIELHRYEEAHELMAGLIEPSENFQLRPRTLLLDAKIYESEDDLETTVTLLENIAKEFPKSIFAAEAWYRIGLIRQLHDRDFERALEAYEQVLVELPRSLFSDLARTKKQAILDFQAVRESFGEEVPDSSAAEIQFKLAENQWLRLENPESAIEEYGKVAEQFPGSSLAPKAIYAIAYIQRHSRADTAAALASVALLLENYPGSEAATFVKYWKRDLGGDAR